MRLLKAEEVAAVLNCSVATVYRMVREESIPYFNLRGGYRFDVNAVLNALRNRDDDDES